MTRSERVGILGIGRMGLPIATRLAAAGFAVVVFDPDSARASAAGTPVASSAGELAAASDILVTVLPGVPEIREVMLGASRLVDSLAPGALWLDFTSNDPRVARQIADEAALRGIDSVGAPMAGGPEAAASGSLRFSAGGSPAAIASVQPLLDRLGTTDVVGPAIEAGYVAKLLANLLWFGQVVAVTEALLLGQSLGLSPAVLRKRLIAGAGSSAFLEDYADRLLAGDYLETFGIDRCVEELETLASLASDAGVPFELATTVSRLHREALERYGAVAGELLAAKLLEDRAGRRLRG